MAVPKPTGLPAGSPRKIRSLRAILFRFTLTPAIALALLLALVFALQQMEDRRQLLLSHGRASAEQLAELIELSGGQPLELRLEWLRRSLLALMLEKDMVRSVQIYSTEGEIDPETGLRLLASAGPRARAAVTAEDLHTQQPFIRETDRNLAVLYPLNGEDITCWIAIELHRPYFTVGTYQVMLAGLLGLIFCAPAALIWSAFLAERFAQRLSRIGDSLDELGQGRFTTRVARSQVRELDWLGKRVNKMAAGLADHRVDFETSLKQSMEDLKESLDSMEEQNVAMDLARKKAVEASRIKSAFLANTSHEIRTPLNGIIGFTNLLLKTDVNELQQDYLRTILRSSENLLTTINDILDFSRIESGNLVLDHIPMNLGQLLEETLQILAPFAYEHNLELVPLIDNQLPHTQIGDPLRIKQILTNLVGNAVRSSKNGNIPVHIGVQNVRESELVVQISVSDLGNRIDDRARREQRQLLENSAPAQGQQINSSNLGLAIARSLLDRMRGSIGFDDTNGAGSTLSVQIPLRLERNSTPPVREGFPHCRLLIADPNPMTRTQVAQLLAHWQVEPIELGDTATLEPAIEQMWRHDALPDAIIVDTGIANREFDPFIATVQQLVDTYQCRIILQGSPVELRRCYESLRTRVLSFLGKPVARDNLLRALRRTLPQQNQARVNGDSPPLPWPSTPRVLAVDDYEANRTLVAELLRTQGIEPVVAASGEEAIDLCHQQTFDLIFMDIQMPGMNGIEATSRIRKRETSGRTPIIALTAHAGSEEKARLLSAGLDDYMSKPVTEAQLTHTIKRWMNILVPQSSNGELLCDPHLVDIAESLSLSNNDAGLARDMLQMLIKGLVEDEQELHRLRSAGDHRGLFELIHRLHGGCCYCGVSRLREATRLLQEHLRPLQEQPESAIDAGKIEIVAREIRALREWASEQNLDALFGLQETTG
ncbi:response regulator [Microbulbifer sp. TYP-18]|uniref:response regulator n=1 Tax=Microbulbifer sp. TYP-18 TaxID=3230024 RepID=UPI0034C60593